MKETVTMSNGEIDKLRVIDHVINHRLTWPEAAAQLDLSIRQIARLVVRVRDDGAKGASHRLRGRASNHRLDPALLKNAVRLVETHYRDFGPTFANEKLKSEHGIHLSTFTLRQGMIDGNLWSFHPSKPRHRAWRARRPCVGEMVQLDGSDHDWFEGRGPRCVLVIYIDDATSRILYGEFVSVENTLNLMTTTRTYVELYGRPGSLYVDKDSVYVINCSPTVEEQLQGEDPLTQFGRAMEQLDIEIINAHSPQAKGRVERGFRTHQDRLVKELRLRGISTVEAANRFLWDVYIPDHNRRCAVAPANPTDAHRPVLKTHDLNRIFSFHHDRVVANDFTLRLDNAFFQILPDQSVIIRPKNKVLIECWLDGSTHLWFNDQALSFKPLPERPYTPFYATNKAPASLALPQSKKSRSDHPWRDFSFQKMLLRKAKQGGLAKAIDQFSHPDRRDENKKLFLAALRK